MFLETATRLNSDSNPNRPAYTKLKKNFDNPEFLFIRSSREEQLFRKWLTEHCVLPVIALHQSKAGMEQARMLSTRAKANLLVEALS